MSKKKECKFCLKDTETIAEFGERVRQEQIKEINELKQQLGAKTVENTRNTWMVYFLLGCIFIYYVLQINFSGQGFP